jgi:DnaJ-class molecular chaperone
MNSLVKQLDEEDIEEILEDEDDSENICAACNGSGEGQYDGTRCSHCKGKGVIWESNDD